MRRLEIVSTVALIAVLILCWHGIEHDIVKVLDVGIVKRVVNDDEPAQPPRHMRRLPFDFAQGTPSIVEG